MALDDLDWVASLARQRRESLARQAPRFWNPAPDASHTHRAFLSHLITQRETLAVRNAHGYLIAIPGDSVWTVDDAEVSAAGRWMTDGVQLLEHARQFCGGLRFVVPVAETHRMDAARHVGLEAVEQWWHRDLPIRGITDDRANEGPAITADGAAGQLVPAPAIYDPGGPVLLVTEVHSAESLDRLESEAIRCGAAVSVVSQEPADATLAALLSKSGYVLTTAFCEGR